MNKYIPPTPEVAFDYAVAQANAGLEHCIARALSNVRQPQPASPVVIAALALRIARLIAIETDARRRVPLIELAHKVLDAEFQRCTIGNPEPVHIGEMVATIGRVRQDFGTKLQDLSPREERIIRLEFGLPHFDQPAGGKPMTRQQVADKLGMKLSSVVMVERRGFRKLNLIAIKAVLEELDEGLHRRFVWRWQTTRPPPEDPDELALIEALR